MGRATIVPGAQIDTLSAEEVRDLLRSEYRQVVETRVRAEKTVTLDATGSGIADVYNPPVGFEFEVRRVFVDIDSAADPSTGSVLLNAAGKFIEYLRAGERIEYGAPSYGAAVQVPGSQTWSREQGPYIRNGEVFQVSAHGLTANVNMRAFVEGILRRPPPVRDY